MPTDPPTHLLPYATAREIERWRLAAAATPGAWEFSLGVDGFVESPSCTVAVTLSSNDSDRSHIAANDPETVRADLVGRWTSRARWHAQIDSDDCPGCLGEDPTPRWWECGPAQIVHEHGCALVADLRPGYPDSRPEDWTPAGRVLLVEGDTHD